jgi:dCTP deaminase
MADWEHIKPGILADFEIKGLCPSKLIINRYDPRCVRQTCYELCVGEIVWYTYIREPESRKVSIKDQGGVYLPPKAYATIITREELKLPADCVGRIMTKGQLFSIGISAVSTYVDPGFSGPLGITLINHSSKPVFIPIGEPIAKIEFTKLSTAVKDPYKGPHLQAGSLWPIPDSYHNVPSSINTKKHPEELKDTIIKEIENKTSLIKVLFIIMVPLIISSIFYWISNWASMGLIAKYVITISSSVAIALAAIITCLKSLSGFFKSLFK